jgi:hypothetical protein
MSNSRSIPTRSSRRRSSTARLRAAHQYRPEPARSHALLQAAVDRGGDVPNRQAPFSTARPSTSSTRPSAAMCSAASSRSCSRKALEDRIAALGRSDFWPEIIADLDSLTETREQARRQALPGSLGATSRRQPRHSRRRRRAPADRPPSRLIPGTRNCSAKPSRRRRSPLSINQLVVRTIAHGSNAGAFTSDQGS